MAIYKLLENNNPILKVPLSGLSEDLDRETLTENLVETMREYNGIGLSAPQCAVMERVFVMYSDVKEQKITACYDPHILEYSEETILMSEGCLTYPGLWLKVKRPISIKAEWEDTKGTKGKYELLGLEAREETFVNSLAAPGSALIKHASTNSKALFANYARAAFLLGHK